MPIPRRTLLTAGAGAVAAALTGCGRTAEPTVPEDPTMVGGTGSGGAAPRLSAPGPRPTGRGVLGTAPTRTPATAVLDLTATLQRHLQPTPQNPRHPVYAGAVALTMVNGRDQLRVAVGEALRYGAGPVLLPESQRVPMRADSIFDLASITKVHTAILVLQQVDKGRIELDAPVVDYLPEFTGTGKSAVTVAMLLAHTGGLPVGPNISGLGTVAERWQAVLATPLVAGAVPGKVFRYSSVGLMVLGKLVEKVTGQRLDQALRTGLTGPLGLRDTGFNPNSWLSSADRQARLVATDARSSRGLLRGVVHDDVANRLNGIAGHAGIFSTAKEVAVIGQLLLNGGTYGGTRILSEATTRRMLSNVNAGLPAIDPERPTRSSAHGLGVVLNQPWFMGKLSSAATFGHTGFTGTSLLVHPGRKLVLVLLTNRAHPNWSWANPDPVRVEVADKVASVTG